MADETNPYIYVIEDEEAISQLICMYLNKSDMTASPFYNAEDALAKLDGDRKPDLIILDLNLPGMSGFDFLQELKKKYTGIRSYLILSYIPGEKKESDTEFYSNFDNIIYPSLERIPPRYAILKRNEWMIDNSDFLIAYVGHNWGGAYKTLQYAKKKNHITTYNIYDQENANEK